jgi:hypothetical protein
VGRFWCPELLGVQEGRYILLGGLLGIPGEIALSLSLVRRIRELALGVPALIIWQFMEATGLWLSQRGSTSLSNS